MPEVLTKIDPDERPSGRDLDITIAERVMQWPRCDYDNGKDYAETYFSAYNDGGQIVVYREGSQRSAERWTPAQSIEAAMEVVEKMRSEGWHLTMSDDDDRSSAIWFVEFLKSDDTHLYTGDAGAETLPHAVCLAALDAVGAE